MMSDERPLSMVENLYERANKEHVFLEETTTEPSQVYPILEVPLPYITDYVRASRTKIHAFHAPPAKPLFG